MKKKIFIVVGIVAALVLTYVIIASVSQWKAKHNIPETTELDSMEFQPPPPPKVLYGIVIDSMVVEEGVIKANENLSEILSRFNISPQTIAEISLLPKDSFNVRRLQTKKPYTIIHESDSQKTARAFIYHPNPIEFVMLQFGDSLSVHNGRNKVDTILEVSSGVIETSLYNTILQDGGTPLLVNELADVYAWVIDFFGLQKGDAFKVIYERYEVNGQDAGMGRIIGSWFRHQGKPFYAVQYDQGEGKEYFDEVGNSLRKAFLKAPLKFSRISSRFSHARLHPVLKITRPHTGVDYAAPTGTPVMSVGDGTVVFAAYSGGGGNTVKVKHNGTYTTGYLHLSKYGNGIKNGVRVSQGQIIGYVGKSGLATGPHLDFRFWKNGQAVDPLKIDPPSANPISKAHEAPYALIKNEMISRLDEIKLTEPESPM
ncbi:MAG: peptidoglycan DD-metalloendopeptidase family protein [Cyclobacteriaceae bacterium]|nr:peptidoglycan DD-metalloendopeptidase family protein [Cyclobacteriaceae bacterium]